MCEAMNYWWDMTQEELNDIIIIWGVNYDYQNEVDILSMNAMKLWFKLWNEESCEVISKD